MKILSSISLVFLLCFLGCGDDGSGLDWSDVADGSGNQSPYDTGGMEGGGETPLGDSFSPEADGFIPSGDGQGEEGGEDNHRADGLAAPAPHAGGQQSARARLGR